MKRNLFYYLFILFVLSSCIGKVEDKNPESSKNAETGSEQISFAGIAKAIAISHDKIEINFLPSVGTQSDLTYLVYVNDSSNAIEVTYDSLELTESGYYRMIVDGLIVNNTYTFSVGVRNNRTGGITSNNKKLSAKTFANYTASFSGISSVAPLEGESGQTSVRVKWVSALSLGSTFSPRANDPIAYEVSYVSAETGNQSDFSNNSSSNLIKYISPYPFGSSPQLSSERERVISGLNPGTKYYFRVRAIHRSYVDFQNIEGYQYEQNNVVLSVTTLDSTGLFDWDGNTFSINTPDGDSALTKIDVRWSSASGPYYGYRIYNLLVGNPGDDPIDVEANAPDFSEVKINELNGTNDYVTIGPDQTFYRIENLTSYAYYKTALVACRNIACTEGQRILSPGILYRVVPKLAPFAGLLEITNPQSLSELDKIKIKFDPPVISSGYINKFELYCFETETDSAPTELLYNVANGSAKANCAGLTRLTDSPSTTSAYSTFKEITIQGNFIPAGQSISDKIYCFGAVPVIEGNNFVKRDVSAAIIKCKTIEIKVPTITEFPGVNSGCDVGADSINVTWNAPSGGIYDRYELFYKEADGTVFNFSNAIGGDVAYTAIDNLSATNYSITGLMPGKKYQYGVLTYISGGTKIYSELNAGVSTCQIPYPVPKFEEWVDIFAIGPKADGKIDPLPGVKEKAYLFETLNDQGQPIEVEVQAADFTPTTAHITQFGDNSGSINFDGIYGSYKQDLTKGRNIYSNSGIIRIAWKDLTFNSGSLSMDDIITNFEVAIQKKDRKFGYRVYRSDDNQNSWQDLTSSSIGYQTVTNSGLIHPIDYSEKDRSNGSDYNYKAAIFTDYSVKNIKNNNGVNRARIYYYKIVPVFNNIELKYEGEDENPQHIIKVVLPPENMGLVHRLMANRQTCMEIGKTYSKDIKDFYTCEWNGVGSRALGVPWVTGQTIYDFGQSLLVDRFEMGCDYSRGDYANQNSTFLAGGLDFKGLSDGGSNFVGCLVNPAVIGPSNILGAEHPGGSTYSSQNQFRVGDCFGDFESTIYNNASTCADPDKVRRSFFAYPGVPNSGSFYDCSSSSNLAPVYFNPYGDGSTIAGSAVQSEFAAVFYNRKNNISDYSGHTLYLRGAGGTGIGDGNDITFSYTNGRRASRCMINIPVQENTLSTVTGEGRLKSRWIPANYLDSLRRNSSTFSILKSTISEVLNDGNLYDADVNSKPSSSYTNENFSVRYDANTPIARILSSNDAKLPPLDGLSQDQANEICSTYEVEVGTYNDSNATFNQMGSKLNKRLIRRTEGIVASSLPKTLDDTEVLSIEDGSIVIPPENGGGINFLGGCNSDERGVEDGHFISDATSGKVMTSKLPGNLNGDSTTPSHPKFWSGSSFYDYNSSQFNTQSCISRYGIQDIVGNMEEYSSEQIFCDFSGESLYIGINGNVAGSVKVGGDNNYDSADLSSWVLSSTDTGRCSVVEAGSSRASTFSSGGFHVPIYDVFGNFNSSMITDISSYDNRSVAYLRNGDGFFLDFGQSNLAPPISLNDTIALKNTPELLARSRDGTDQRRGRYFNPIFGIPLECPSTYCNNSEDNKSISINEFVNDFGLDPSAFDVPNFPVGNSQIYSDGMSEVNRYSGFYKSPDTISYSYDYIDSVTPPSTLNNYSTLNGGSLKSSDDNDGTSVDRVNWVVARNVPMHFLNFGRSNLEGAGRYSATLRGRAKQWQYNHDTGFRCVVRLGNLGE